ncbi:hypothetical protein VTN77DRAFT_2267 [Rasamsonia byssochlamydoides]|uniref:uncharacterized protein n=1 Tax=Rasamsonia byssochlamydoides TaxID=89139 RepID=UPI003743B851
MANDGGSKIDRQRLVRRHNPVRTASNLISPMQVGNGRFAFGADITGLQTFVPFPTVSEWGWKNDQFPPGASLSDYRGQDWDTHGRSVNYDMPDPQTPVSQWLISNPNRMNLGRIGLWFGDRSVSESDLEFSTQTLDLWTGTIHSSLMWEGVDITVQTSVHPEKDAVGVKIDSPLVRSGRLSVFLDFPFNNGKSKFSAPYVGIWDQPDSHRTAIEAVQSTQARLSHCLDDAKYHVVLQWNQKGQVKHLTDHRYVLELELSDPSSSLEFSATFGLQPVEPLDAQTIAKASEEYWPSFWQSGGAIDLSGSSDSRWFELERRIVLGQYVMAVNATGNYPPQESGLVNLGWYGKFHMEMNWWHTAYLALFNKWPLLYRSLEVYNRFLPGAIERASSQGYKGARWPKMTDPSGRMAPGEINALLIWQQPHPMAFAELDYRAHPRRETLEKWKPIMAATADFMASYAVWNESSSVYDLGPPLHVVSENTDPRITYNAAFELEYWRFGLSVAVEWWKRLGLEPEESWSTVLKGLAPLPIQDGLYVLWPGIKNMWTEYNWEHPALAGLYGWLPGSNRLDLSVMKATSQQIWKTWRLDDCWGWDFGVLAMNAARIGEPAKAVDFLLDENMPFDDVGLAPGGSRVPFPYLPSSGAFLYAIAFMAAGWDGAPDRNAPGFPSEGWDVKWEGLSKAL